MSVYAGQLVATEEVPPAFVVPPAAVVPPFDVPAVDELPAADEAPPVGREPPVAVAPPAVAELPPVAGIPPVALAEEPPVLGVPPVAGAVVEALVVPPVALLPPVAFAPPVEVTVLPPVAAVTVLGVSLELPQPEVTAKTLMLTRLVKMLRVLMLSPFPQGLARRGPTSPSGHSTPTKRSLAPRIFRPQADFGSDMSLSRPRTHGFENRRVAAGQLLEASGHSRVRHRIPRNIVPRTWRGIFGTHSK